jgi:hypothetical protein
MFMINCAMLAFRLVSLDDVEMICKRAAQITCPEKDISGMVFPSRWAIRRWMVRLDLLHSLAQRRLHTDDLWRRSFRVSRSISTSS